MTNEEHKTCFYCNALVTFDCEDDHFPIPSCAGGEETVPCCISCHDMKDRFKLENWPIEWLSKTIADFPLFSRETKLLLAKIIRVYAESQARTGTKLTKIPYEIGTTEVIDTVVSRLPATPAKCHGRQATKCASSSTGSISQRSKRISGQIPFGYDLAVDGRTLNPNPAETAALERIRTAHAAGQSLRSIATALNTDGVKPKYAKQWGASSVRSILERCNNDARKKNPAINPPASCPGIR